MKIAYFGVTQDEKTYLTSRISEAGLDGNVVFSDEKLQKEDISTKMDFDIISVFVDSKIDKPVLDAFPNLKYIMARSVGYDHIDLTEAKKRGIIVSNVPSYGDHTVAEFTFALILTLSRKIFLSVDRIRETGSFSIEGLRGFDLKDKTIGVVGTGKIGKKVIELARGFGMNIIAQDAFPDKKAAEALGFQYVSFDELINLPNVVITPHNAFNSKEALERILDASVDSIKGFLEGAPPNAVSQ